MFGQPQKSNGQPHNIIRTKYFMPTTNFSGLITRVLTYKKKSRDQPTTKLTAKKCKPTTNLSKISELTTKFLNQEKSMSNSFLVDPIFQITTKKF